MERIAEGFRPDQAILDVDLGPGLDGFAVARHLHGISDVPIGPRVVMRSGHVVKLTPTEYELLLVLARATGRVLSKSDLFNHLWGFDPGDAHVVEVRISAVRRKLEEHDPRVIRTVRGVGYVLRF